MRTKLTFLLVMLSIGLCAQQRQRLIAVARYYDTTNIGNPGVLVLRDSALLSYSNERGSTFNPNTLDYFDLNRFQGGGALINFSNHVAPANNVDSGAAYPHVAFDTLRFYEANPYYGIRLDQAEACTYYADGSFYEVSHLRGPGDPPSLHYRQILQYTAGQLSRIYIQYVDNGSYYIASARYLVRDASGNIVLDSTMLYANGSPLRPAGRTIYTYNSIGQYTTRLKQQYSGIADSFTNEIRYTNTYYPDGKLHTSLVAIPWGGSATPRPYHIDSFGYTPGVRGYTTFKEIGLTIQGVPDPGMYYLSTAHINANLQKDTITIVQANGTPTYRTVQVPRYNSDGNPESNSYDYYSDSSKIHQGKTYYYYEQYHPASINHHHASDVAGISIFPNPTTGIIILDYPGVKPGTAVSIRITNASGQLMQAESFMMQESFQRIVLDGETAPGTYYLSVYDARGGLISSKSFVRF